LVTLTGPSPDSGSDNGSASHERDDLSDNSHRQLIGYIGLGLPIILVLLAAIRPTTNLPRWGILDSVSAYYYTGAVAAFVGMLVALALFLLTYRGYRNKYHWVDRVAGITAGCAAIGVAFFPTEAPKGVPALAWWSKPVGVTHYVSAVVLFAMFALFSLWLFRLGTSDHPPAGKRWRNRIYLTCGLAILVNMAWAAIAGARDKPIFLPESLALVAFAVSWLVKGRAHKTIAHAIRSVVS
jgi:succinate dehydrogenase/fumarate reductase cytochrome b subunit